MNAHGLAARAAGLFRVFRAYKQHKLEEQRVEELSKNYDSEALEPRILDKWLTGGYYARRPGVGDCTVTIPPPNVTGVLHMGHAMDDTIQDTIIRFNRMRGVSTRWILGTDHAGIATQTKVDKKLAAQGISRRELGREKFIDACWDWTHEYGGHIIEQIKRMGCSVDFSDDPHFTMDRRICAPPCARCSAIGTMTALSTAASAS